MREKLKDELALFIRAAQFAAQKHKDCRRKDADETPYINHPIAVAATLSEAGVRDVELLAAALLHDTIEDTDATYDEVHGEFGKRIADLVAEVTDDKSLEKKERKRLQVLRAGRLSSGAKLIKLADKICNLRDILDSPPAEWSTSRKREYFDWAKQVVDEVQGTHPVLEEIFDDLYRRKPD
jgi:guanosine-3',5'-bis(diphosphate) 3'-pyrophosphohydrolase